MPRPKGSQNKAQKKLKKNDDAPKKGKSAFFYYLDSQRGYIQSKSQSAKHTEIISELSQRWKQLSEYEKFPFVRLAHLDRERFIREKNEYLAKNKEEIKLKKETTDGKRFSIMEIGEPKLVKKRKILNKTNALEVTIETKIVLKNDQFIDKK